MTNEPSLSALPAPSGTEVLSVLEAGSTEAKPAAPKRSRSQASTLVELAAGVELFHDDDGTPFATFETGGIRRTWPVRSKGFKSWLSKLHYDATGNVATAQAMQDALAALEGRAIHDGPKAQVFIRLGEHAGRLYLDLCNDKWEAIEIRPDGWRVIQNPPVRFRRARNAHPLPYPITGGNLGTLSKFVNVTSDEDLALVIGWLVFTLNPHGPYPVLALSGEQGSAKSTATKLLKMLVDPSKAPLKQPPRNEEELIVAAQHGRVTALDNLSKIPDWLADALCRLATGGGLSKRELYSDAEEIVLEAKQPVIFNGIGELIERPDLLDRALPVTLKMIQDGTYREEADVWKEFEVAAPALLGAILDAASCALRRLPSVQLTAKPRMADFARWVEAAAPALGWPQGYFVGIYAGSRTKGREEAVADNPLAGILLTLAESAPWRGTATELLALVQAGMNQSREAPATNRALTNQLKRLAPVLRTVGLEIRFGRTGRRRWIALERKSELQRNAASQPSPASHTGAEAESPGDDSPFSVTDLERMADEAASQTKAGSTVVQSAGDANDATNPDLSSLLALEVNTQ